MADMIHRAPLTLEVVLQVLEILSRRKLTREDFRVELNKLLPEKRHIPATHAGIVRLNRWLNPTSKDWPEPYGEITLAMKKYAENEK